MDGVPKTTIIRFVGYSEPFVNQECCDMILWTHEQGYRIGIFSTLVGLTPKDADRILHIPFTEFILHLPDAEGNAHIHITPKYLAVLGKVLKRVHNLTFMHMAADFVTNNRENAARGLAKRKEGRVHCWLMDTSNYQIRPNGDVLFCCYTTMTGKVGSLYENTYPEIIAKYKEHGYWMQTDPESLCHYCDHSYPHWQSHFKKAKAKLFGDKPLKDLL